MQHRFWILAALSLVALPAGALAAVPMLPGTGGVTFVAGGYELVNVTLDAPTVYLMPAWIALVSVVLLVRRPPLASA